MDTKYWKEFYEKNGGKNKNNPSPFVKYCVENIIPKSCSTILDVGCGDGRDTYFLRKNGFKTFGIDLSPPSDDDFIICDMVDIDKLNLKCDIIYSRFSLHSINNTSQQKFLTNSYQILNKDGHILIETRSINDNLCGTGEKISDNEWRSTTSYANSHYRRFVSIEEIHDALEQVGFTIVNIEESNKFAIYKDTAPVCIRVVAKK